MTSPLGAPKAQEYDLVAANQFGWVRGVKWFRIGLATFAVVLTALVAEGVYKKAVAGQLDSAHLVGAVLSFVILGLFLFVCAALRSPAVRLSLSDEGVRLIYRRGGPYLRRWDDPSIVIRGRWTEGVQDTISRGKPRYSVYGRFQGLTESFVPEEAFRALRAQAKARSLYLTEHSGNPGWTLYQLKREQFRP